PGCTLLPYTTLFRSLGDFAEEPDERRHRGRGDQPRPDLLRRSVGPDWRRRRDPRRNPRGGETLPPVVPARTARLGGHPLPIKQRLSAELDPLDLVIR